MSHIFVFLVVPCYFGAFRGIYGQMFNGFGGGMYNNQYEYNPYSMYSGYGGYGMSGMNTGGYSNMFLNPYMDSINSLGGMNNYGPMTAMPGSMGGLGSMGNFGMSPYSVYGGYGMGNGMTSGGSYFNNGLSFTNFGNTGNPYGRVNTLSKNYGLPSNSNLNGLQSTGSGGSYRPSAAGSCGGRRCAWETSVTKN